MKNLKNQLQHINGEFYSWITDLIKNNQSKIDNQSSVILYNIIQTFFADREHGKVMQFLEHKLKHLELSDLESLPVIQCLKLSSSQLFEESPLCNFFTSLRQDFEFTGNTNDHVADRKDLFSMDEEGRDEIIAEIIESAHLSTDLLNLPLLGDLSDIDVLYLQTAMLEAYEKYDLPMGNSLLRTLCYLGKVNLAADAAINYLLAQQNIIGYFGQTLHDQEMNSADDFLAFLDLQFDCLWSLNEAGNQNFSLMESIRQEYGFVL